MKSSGPQEASLPTKLVEVMEFQLSYLKYRKMMLLSVALNMPANLESSAVATGLEKVSFHSNPKERQCQRMFKLLHNYTHFTCWQSNAQNSPSQASTVHNRELLDVQAGFRKARRIRDQIASIHWINEKAREFQKNIYFCFIDNAKAFVCVYHNNCGKFFKRW